MMKKILLLAFLLVSCLTYSQIVSIPDIEFKNMLLNAGVSEPNQIAKNSAGEWMVIDANADGEIQESEALEVWELHIINALESAQGIGSFTNLRRLINQTVNTSLDCTDLVNLNFLDCTSTNLTSLSVAGLTNLETLTLYDCNFIAGLDLSGLENLKVLDLRATWALQEADFSQVPNLETFYISESQITAFDFSNMLHLKELHVANFSVYGGIIEELVLGEKPELTHLYIDNDGPISSLDLSGCTVLTILMVSFYGGEQTEVTSSFLNMKNGITDYESILLDFDSFNDGSNLTLYVCIEEGTEELFSNYIDYHHILISTYCSFMPGGNYNTVMGNITFDADGNGCDGTTSYNSFLKINVSGNNETGQIVSNNQGHYNFYPNEGTFTLTPQFENDWFVATPASAQMTYSELDNTTVSQNFCIAPNGVHTDVEVIIVPLFPPASPGFNSSYIIVYKNKGNQLMSGTITFNYDETILDYINALPIQTTANSGALVWDYSNLAPFESRSIIVTLNLNGPMEEPAVNIGDHLIFNAVITPLENDETESDNFFNIKQGVVGSFDPNDITCLEGESVSPDKIGEYLHYNINFENTGTAPATFIVVKDIIDETKFDISSLQLMDASHAVETRINGNKVEFIFDNVNLGPEEKGNVTFKIKTKNTLQVNDDVTQQADIFFDYNWPIQTNEATTTFEVLSRGEFAMDNSVKVYPNPAKDIITITANSNVRSIQLYDIQGRLLRSATVNDVHTTLDLSSRMAGIYFIKVLTDKGMKVEKVVKE